MFLKTTSATTKLKHLCIDRNNMTFVPTSSNIIVREVAFCIPVQLTFEWLFHARSAVLATLTAISFNPKDILQSRYYYVHHSWENQCSKRASRVLWLSSLPLRYKKLVARRVLRNLTNDGLLRLTQWVWTKNQVFQFPVQLLSPHYSIATQSAGFSQEVFGWDSKPARCK